MLDCIQNQQEITLASKLDKSQYNDKELISIKTPLNLPYYSSSPSYERAYGSVNVNGVEYEYVKRRVYNDTLELLCLPNHEKTKLQAAKNDFVKLSVDGQPSQSNKKSAEITKISLPDFSQEMNTFSMTAITVADHNYFLSNFNFISADHSLCQYQPPEEA